MTIGELIGDLRMDFQIRGKATAANLSHLKRAETDFGYMRASALTAEAVDAYSQKRVAAGDANASINRTIATVVQAYRLAVRRKHLAAVPYFRRLPENNVRTGFVSDEQLNDILAHLPDDGLRDYVEWCSLTGQRKMEAIAMTWQMIQDGVLTIPAGLCKNRRARTIPLGPELAAIITRREKARRIMAIDGTAQLAEPIFHRGDGRPIGNFIKGWRSACKRAGIPGKLFHDLRRSCARRLLAAGVSQQVAKQFTGHRTDSMFARYAIVDNADLLAAQKKVAEFRKAAV